MHLMHTCTVDVGYYCIGIYRCHMTPPQVKECVPADLQPSVSVGGGMAFKLIFTNQCF